MPGNARDNIANDDFTAFFTEKLRPEVERIGKRRQAALRNSILAAIAVFAAFFGVVYYFLSPYHEMLGEHNIRYWPLMVLLPATMGVIGFSLSYILTLRSMVANFRETLVGRMGEFIDPAMIHEPERPMAEEQLRQSLLFGDAATPKSGNDHFRGRHGAAAYEMAPIWVEEKDRDTMEGIFFTARFERRFPALLVVLTSTVPASLGGMKDRLAGQNFQHTDELVRLDVPGYPLQLVTRPHDQEGAKRLLAAVFTPDLLVYCHQRSLDPSLSCLGDKLSIALVKARPDLKKKAKEQALLETFDFANCRDFCRDARMCFKVTDELARNMAIWEARVN